MLNTTAFYYFSPTGGTRKVGELFCKAISEQVYAVDLAAKGGLNQPEGDLAVFAVPVFGGRIPSSAAKNCVN